MNTKRLEAIRGRIVDGGYRRHHHLALPDLVAECDAANLTWPQRAARLVRRMCEAEQPAIEPDERIVFVRTITGVPAVYSPAEMERRTSGRTLHELGPISNICADWGMVLAQGLDERRRIAVEARARMSGDHEAVEFLDGAIETIDAVLVLAARYRVEAERMGAQEVAALLARVPAHPATTFHEALQALRILHAVVWMCGHYHVGLGRFDQYLWPYLDADLGAGRLSLDEAEELTIEFFLSLNKDSDLYPGVQQGDNGQSLMLGGVRRDGGDGVNELTHIALRAALWTNLIDPKINLRISPGTELSLLSLASELTRKGLGFPQYSNDDVVIPALVAYGYRLEDARNYTVAACWEFIIPGDGMEVVNIGAVSFPSAVDRAIRDGFSAGDEFGGILSRVAEDMRQQVQSVVEPYRRLLLPPAPYYSVVMNGCLERGRDLSTGLRYNNFGIHGAGSANAADALAGVRHFVFEEQTVRPEQLLAALDAGFEACESLRQDLVSKGPKVGNDAEADVLLAQLFDMFAEACESVADNGRGGRVRPGSGSAMYYVWLARGGPGEPAAPIGATADGRKPGDFFSANLAPSPHVQVRGPLSVLQAFSGIDYQRICNGGPVTMEISDAAFSEKEALHKCALLVRTFARVGCQQLQLNTLNADRLIEAKAHPERHRNLIVRVWGWSGYFCELAPEYQDHIIERWRHAL
jgi:pyruvate-formate lyase